MVNWATTSRESFKYVLVLVCVLTRIVYRYGMKRKSDALSCFQRFRDDICAFSVRTLCLPANLGYGNDIDYVRTDVDGVFTDPCFTKCARTSVLEPAESSLIRRRQTNHRHILLITLFRQYVG